MKLAAAGLSILVWYGKTVGMGKRTIDIPYDDLLPLRRCLFGFLVLYVSSLPTSTTSSDDLESYCNVD
jgi:hypothetical protein